MPHTETKSKVWHLIAEVLQVDIADVHDRAHLRETLNADSLDLVELRIALETEFGIDIPDAVFDGAVIVGDVVAITAAAQSLAVSELQALNRRIRAAGAVA